VCLFPRVDSLTGAHSSSVRRKERGNKENGRIRLGNVSEQPFEGL